MIYEQMAAYMLSCMLLHCYLLKISLVLPLSQIKIKSPIPFFGHLKLRVPFRSLEHNQSTISHRSRYVIFLIIDYVEISGILKVKVGYLI